MYKQNIWDRLQVGLKQQMDPEIQLTEIVPWIWGFGKKKTVQITNEARKLSHDKGNLKNHVLVWVDN